MGSFRVHLALVLLSLIAECCLAQEFNSRLQSFPNGAGFTNPNLRAALQRLVHDRKWPHRDVLTNRWDTSKSRGSLELEPRAGDSTAYSLRSALPLNSVDLSESSEAQESTVQNRMEKPEADNMVEELGESESAQRSSSPASENDANQSHETAARAASLEATKQPEKAPVDEIGKKGKPRSGLEPNPGQYVGNTLNSQRNYLGNLMPYKQYFPGYPYGPNLVYPQFSPGCFRDLDPTGVARQLYYPHAYPYSSYPLVYPYPMNKQIGNKQV